MPLTCLSAGPERSSTDYQLERIEAELRTLELHRADRIKASHLDAAPPAPAQRKNGDREVGGIPLRVRRTGGARWLRSLLRKPGKAPGDIQ